LPREHVYLAVAELRGLGGATQQGDFISLINEGDMHKNTDIQKVYLVMYTRRTGEELIILFSFDATRTG
jgi:hypothetical protein